MSTTEPAPDMRVVWRERLDKLVKIVRVEKQGKYSMRRVAAVAKYTRKTSVFRTAVVVLLTPVPCLAVTLLIELIPLNSPYSQLEDGGPTVARSFILVTILSFILFQQFADFLPTLPFSFLQNLTQSVVVTIGSIGTSFLVAWRVGSPVPFSLITTSPVWMILIAITLVVTWGKHIREQGDALRQPIKDAIMVWSRQNTLVCIFPAYYFIYNLLPHSLKTGALFLLPAIKVGLRIWYCNSMTHLRDELLELVIMSVDVFSALFSMYCMQITPSLLTTLGLMVLDFMQLILALHDISLLLGEVVDIHERVGDKDSNSHARSLRHQCTYIDRAAGIIDTASRAPGSPAGPPSRPRSMSSINRLSTMGRVRRISAFLSISRHTITPVTVRPQPVEQDIPPVAADTTVKIQVRRALHGEDPSIANVGVLERRYLDAVRRLLYVMEFLLLVHYVEFIIPFIFGTFVTMLTHSPLWLGK